MYIVQYTLGTLRIIHTFGAIISLGTYTLCAHAVHSFGSLSTALILYNTVQCTVYSVQCTVYTLVNKKSGKLEVHIAQLKP